MALKAVVDNLDDVDKGYHSLYTEQDGKFVFTGLENVLDHPAVSKLKTENGARRISEKKAVDKLKTYEVFGDRKPEDILASLDRIPELEALAAGKVDEKKLEEIVSGRIQTKLGPVERQLKEAQSKLAERDETIKTYVTRENTRKVHDAVREAVAKSQGFNASAMEDVLMFAERHMEVGEDGKVSTKAEVGVTPGIDAVVWLSEMQQRKPHWWGTTSGGGAGGNRGNGGGGTNNPWTAEHWNVTEQGRIAGADINRANQLAKSAGVTVGATRPAAARK